MSNFEKWKLPHGNLRTRIYSSTIPIPFLFCIAYHLQKYFPGGRAWVETSWKFIFLLISNSFSFFPCSIYVLSKRILFFISSCPQKVWLVACVTKLQVDFVCTQKEISTLGRRVPFNFENISFWTFS